MARRNGVEALVGDKVIGVRSEELPCKLSPDELASKAGRQSDLVEQLDQVYAERSEVSTRLGAKAKGLEKELLELARVYRTGTEKRPVQVREEADFRARVVYSVREDTGEVVSERTMTAAELQEEFRFRTGGRKSKAGHATIEVESEALESSERKALPPHRDEPKAE